MNTRFWKRTCAATGLALALGFNTLSFAGFPTPLVTSGPAVASARAESALSFLPASDTVLLVDMNRLYTSVIFQIARDNPKFAKDLSEVESMAGTFGIDLSKLEYLAVGVTPKSGNPNDFDATFVLTGAFNQEQLVTGLKNKSEGKIGTETYGSDTLYVLNDAAGATTTATKEKKVLTNDDFNGGSEPKPEKAPAASGSMKMSDMAFSFVNANTVVFGPKANVLKSLDTRSGKSPSITANKDLVDGLDASDKVSTIRFATVVPAKFRKDLEKEMANDPKAEMFIKPLLAVTHSFGAVDFSSGLKLDTTLRTPSADEGKPIFDQLNGLLMLGKMGMGNSDKPNEKMMLDVLNQISILNKGRDIQIQLSVPESTLKTLLVGNQKAPQ